MDGISREDFRKSANRLSAMELPAQQRPNIAAGQL
jgi:hypothetical protein